TFDAVSGTSFLRLIANGNFFFPALVAGASCTAAVDVIATAPGTYDNRSTALSTSGASSGFAVATLSVPLEFLSKSFVDDPVAPGGTVTLDLTLTNLDRNFSATDIAFTDDLSAVLPGLLFASLISNDCSAAPGGVGGSTITFSGGTLPPQGSCTLRLELQVPAGAAPGSYLNTTSAVTANIGGSPFVGNMATDFLRVSPAPAITKQFLGDPVNPGDSVVLEFTVTNTSPTSAATDIAFEDVFENILGTASVTPGNGCCGAGSTCTFTPIFSPVPPCDPCDAIPARLTISGGNLAPAGSPGDSCTFSLTLDVAADAAPGTYPNTTTDISATVDGATRVGLGASDDLTVVAAPSLSKSFTDDPVDPGGTVTLEFTLELSPNSPTAATDISFTDDLNATLAGLSANLPPSPDPPCGPGSSLTGSAGDTFLTFAGGSLNPGESCTFSVTLDVPPAATSGTYPNTTSAVSATVSGAPTNSASASADLFVASLRFTKEFLGDPYLPADVATLRFTIEKAEITDDVTAITFSDSLSTALSGLAVFGPLPTAPCGAGSLISGTTFLIFAGGNLPPGVRSCTFDVDVLLPGGAADGTYINVSSNLTATINASGPLFFDPAI
ncbi:MAG: DUF11 domain-containing protein, partial [Holophagales bacterium]|nr:DUF11 domain-containing protein [Holophagales bacterium]